MPIAFVVSHFSISTHGQFLLFAELESADYIAENSTGDERIVILKSTLDFICLVLVYDFSIKIRGRFII